MNNLPNLSEWHEVPRGTIIPQGTRWVAFYEDGNFAAHNYKVDTGDYSAVTKFYTAEPIERTLAQVIEAAYNSLGDWESAAQAARDFLAPKESEYVIDNDNDKWVRNDEGVVIRAEGITPHVAKYKNPMFYEHESRAMDRGEVDIEDAAS